MPFFSGNRRGSAGGSFGHAFLPVSTAKPKPIRKPSGIRRRNPLSPSSTFFAIGISLSLLLFLAVFLRYGVPNHLSSPTSSTLKSSQVVHRPSIRRSTSKSDGAGTGGAKRSGGEIFTARVDITTKDLYDRIEFRDVDGGAWKQGWEVKCDGNEWDEEKLKVFVVPHSHNDPGWKLTVEEYYNRQSRRILDTIVESLSRDVRRKFIWEEISYLERWWRDASELKRESFTNLVKNGQLEIVVGGWVMNDEANSHYFAIIDQIMEGNMWLNDTIGVVPKNSWAIDPFGYSATMAYLLRRMGFRNMLIQRTHYEVKKELSLHKNLEYIWRQAWDVDEATDIFVHMMPFYSYDIPHTCGPEPAICCQFDFGRMHGFGYEYCPWGISPVETSPSNVQERASKLLDQYRKKSTLYRTNTLLVPLGDDFRYVSVEEAEAQFRNYQMLFDYINSNPTLRAEAKFGTLEDYFSTLREEAERKNYSRRGEIGSAELDGFPSLSGDFFTYADRNQDYWSGYYVSRPFFKAVDRILEQTLRASEIMVSFVLGYCQKLQCSKLPVNFSHKLTAARRNLALFQHHDGVTGTAKDHVVEDYGTRMHTSLQDLQIFLSRAVEVLLGDIHDKRDPTVLSKFEPEQMRSRYDVQAVHRILDIHEGQSHSVVLFNPSEQTRVEVVMVVTSAPDVSVIDSNRACVPSQISPELQPSTNGDIFTGHHRLYWKASVPPMGLETYHVTRGFKSCENAAPAEVKITPGLSSLSCPSPYTCSKLGDEKVEIRNAHHTLIVDVSHGLIQQIVHKDGRKTILGEEIGMYSSSGSGAYLFKPTGEARTIVEKGGHLIISSGPLVQESFSIPKTTCSKTPVSHSTRIYKGENTLQELLIEKEYHVDIVGREFNDRELIVRFKTDVDNKRIFYSDLNGFQMSRRETYDKIPLQGNYYPMPSLAFLQDASGRRFSVHSRQSLGAASLENGWLEIMLDRRLVNDDGRGLGQGVMDNRPINVVFHILVESNVSVAASSTQSLTSQQSILSHSVGARLNYPMQAFVSRKEEAVPAKPFSGTFAPLASSLPCDLHIVNLKVPRPVKFPEDQTADPRFVILLQRRGWDSSYCGKGELLQCSLLSKEPVNLLNMFKDLSVQNMKPTSLNLLHDDDAEMLGYVGQSQEGNLLLYPMEIQAFKLELQRRN